MSKTLVVFGATGNQGTSIINHVLDDSELSAIYKIRAVTRNTSSEKAQTLISRNVEVVAGDPDDISSLRHAMQDAHTVFAMTTTNYAGAEGHSELAQGKNMVDAAIAAGVDFIIWSTLPGPTKISQGKYTKVVSFDAKAEVENYIRSKSITSAFFSPGSFMQNYAAMMKPNPSPANDGSYVIARPVSPSTRLPLLDIAGDTGKFVAAILADPDKFKGKGICGTSQLYTMEEQAQIIGQATGKVVRYEQISPDVYRSFLPPTMVDELVQMLLYQEEFGYYGPDTEKLVAWSVQNARGKPISFAEFLKKHPLALA